jgi:hypothetical protein
VGAQRAVLAVWQLGNRYLVALARRLPQWGRAQEHQPVCSPSAVAACGLWVKKFPENVNGTLKSRLPSRNDDVGTMFPQIAATLCQCSEGACAASGDHTLLLKHASRSVCPQAVLRTALTLA